MRLLNKIFVWLKRIRYRKGYGVHSPFAFNFITDVIYEKAAYYNYAKFKQLPSTKTESTKVAHLLFRLVNYQQPKTIYYYTEGEDISSLFRWAKSDVQFVDTTNTSTLIDLVYLVLQPNKSNNVIELVEHIQPMLSKDAMLVVYGIGYHKLIQKQWCKIINLPTAGISFDLYDLGILFFKQDKNKQDYIVNF
ncbi:MAG: hypothetical protein ACRC9P_03255 [Bacteroides sp.]